MAVVGKGDERRGPKLWGVGFADVKWGKRRKKSKGKKGEKAVKDERNRCDRKDIL